MAKVNILGVKINNASSKETMEKIRGFLNSNSEHYVATVNSEIIVAAQKDKKFLKIINHANLSVCDGFGPILASFFISKTDRLKERVAGVDLVYWIVNYCNISEIKYKIFFLGAKKDTARMAAAKLKEKFSKFEVAGTFGGIADEKGDRVTLSIINQARPDILFVAYGAPKQEKWIARNLKKMPGVKVAIGVGGAFDIISGRIARAPLWMRNYGLEWLWRLLKEPWRIGRIYNMMIKFSWLVLVKKINR